MLERWLRLYPLWDKGEGGGGNANGDDADDTEDPSGGDEPEKGKDDDPKGKKKETPDDDNRPTFAQMMEDDEFKTDAQAWVDEKIEDRLKRDRKNRRTKELEDKEEFKTLAEERATQIETLEKEKETLTESKSDLEKQLKAANDALTTYVESLKEGVDEAVLELLEAKSLPDQLAWLSKHASQTEPDGGDKKKRPVPPSPKPGDEGDAAKKQSDEQAKGQSARRYVSNF